MVGSIVVLPLWYVATHSRRLYTLIVGGVVAVAVGLLLISRIVRGVRSSGPRYLWRLIAGVGKGLMVVGFLAALYGILWLFSIRMFGAAVPAVLLYLVLLGIYRFGRNRA